MLPHACIKVILPIKILENGNDTISTGNERTNDANEPPPQ